MYHDLILALNGICGDVFYLDGLEDIKVRMDIQIPMFHSADLLVINDILEIASLYKVLNDFLETRQNISFDLKGSVEPSGIYVSALCNGIREIVDEYIDVVAQLEMEIVEDPHVTLNHIRVQLEPYRGVFRCLKKLTTTVKRQQKSSAVIMELVKAEYDENVHLQDSLQKLIPWMNRSFYRHIINWVVYGTLADPFEEFFIQKRKCDSDTTDGIFDLGRRRMGKKLAQKYKTSQHLADYSLVPTYLNNSLIERILFIGDSVAILESSEKTKTILLSKQKGFFERLKDLPVDTFRTEDLCEAMEELSVSIGKDLHQVVVADADLAKHVGIIKDFYLTGRGELFHDFLASLIQNSDARMRSSKIDLTSIFTLSATRVQLPEDILQRIEIKFSTEPGQKESLDVYVSNIIILLELDWPLQIIFNEEVIKEYNKLFGFLLQVRLIQLGLNSIWVSTKKVFRFPVPKGPAQLRIIMSYFIDHLQHYLQADVLESQYSIFKAELDKSENFEQIRASHQIFLKNILFQSFLNEKRVYHFLKELIKVCNEFVKFMRAHIAECELKDLPINEGITEEILRFSSEFKRTMELLLNLLKGLAANPHSGNSLKQFLLLLDFNSYFSKILEL